MNKESLNPI